MKIQLINIVKEALDIEEETIDLNTQFDSLDTWDSLGKLSLIALIDESLMFKFQTKNLILLKH